MVLQVFVLHISDGWTYLGLVLPSIATDPDKLTLASRGIERVTVAALWKSTES